MFPACGDERATTLASYTHCVCSPRGDERQAVTALTTISKCSPRAGMNGRFVGTTACCQCVPRKGVIITADSDAGLLDIHDRRPVVLSPEAAANWMDPELDPEEARMMIAHHAVPSEAFEWWPVDRAVGSVRNQGAQLIERRADAREGW